MTTLQFEHIGLNGLQGVFEEILKHAYNRKLFLFTSPMGSGKTTFINAACNYFGITSSPSSPTYAIVNVYNTTNYDKLYHIDCYRLKDLQEAIDAGVDECIESGDYCFIEWAQIINPLYPDNYIHIDILPNGDLRNIIVEIR